jgi:hypothetical protein
MAIALPSEKENFIGFGHSYKTRPGQGAGSRVLGVNSGQPGLTRKNFKKYI